MAEDDTPIPDSLLPYDEWTEDALRLVVMRALQHVEREGLPGDHHFYVTFETGHPDVVLPDRLRAQYPEDMTIVLQHQFQALNVDEAQRSFSVKLSFGGVPSTLVIPFDAVTAFADPVVRFGLQFAARHPAQSEAPEAPAAEEPQAPAQEQGPAEVVRLDAFRRRPPAKD